MVAKLIAVLAAAALLGSAAACGGDKPPQQSDMAGGIAVSQSAIVEARALPDPFQWELLRDGRLDFDEYTRAAYALVSCAHEAGAELERPLKPTAYGVYDMVFLYRVESGAGAALERCRGQFSIVQRVWETTHGPDERLLQQARRVLGRCLREAGADLPEQPSSEDFQRLMQRERERFGLAYIRCVDTVNEEVGVPHFGG